MIIATCLSSHEVTLHTSELPAITASDNIRRTNCYMMLGAEFHEKLLALGADGDEALFDLF